MAFVTLAHNGGKFRVERMVELFGQLRAHLARRRIYKRTIAELGALTDRELADLGIHRTMIASIAREAARNA